MVSCDVPTLHLRRGACCSALAWSLRIARHQREQLLCVLLVLASILCGMLDQSSLQSELPTLGHWAVCVHCMPLCWNALCEEVGRSTCCEEHGRRVCRTAAEQHAWGCRVWGRVEGSRICVPTQHVDQCVIASQI